MDRQWRPRSTPRPQQHPTRPAVPQDVEAEPWQPRPEDYLYTSYTNVFAFSPTDTMPLTRRAKGIFTLQSAVALLTMLVTLGLAVNNLT